MSVPFDESSSPGPGDPGGSGVRVLLVRHGEPLRGSADPGLTERGRAQAAALATALAITDDDRLVSSTLYRAVETATAFGRDPEQLRDLDEFRFGASWTWQQGDDREDLVFWRPEHRVGDGESLAEFQLRVAAAVDGLLADPPRGRLVLVVHGGVIDALVRWVFGLGPEDPWTTEVTAPHASVAELRHWPRGRHARGAPRHTYVVRLGDTTHLSSELRSGEDDD